MELMQQVVKKEEVKEVEKEVVKKEPSITQKREQAYEDKARKQGWRPEDEWDGDPADWKPAKEFVRDGEFIDQIKGLKSELLKRDMRLEGENQKIRQFLQEQKVAEYERARRDLEIAQKHAIENEDTKGAMKLERDIAKFDDKIEKVGEEVKQQAKTGAQPSPEFLEWAEKNKWYFEDGDLRVEADGLAISYTAKNPGVEAKKVLDYVERTIKKVNPEKFGKKAIEEEEESPKKKVSAVESGGRSNSPGAKKQKYSKADLNEDQLKAFNLIVKDRKLVTEEEYFKDFEKNLSRG
mgnify:CR=1 FL=1